MEQRKPVSKRKRSGQGANEEQCVSSPKKQSRINCAENLSSNSELQVKLNKYSDLSKTKKSKRNTDSIGMDVLLSGSEDSSDSDKDTRIIQSNSGRKLHEENSDDDDDDSDDDDDEDDDDDNDYLEEAKSKSVETVSSSSNRSLEKAGNSKKKVVASLNRHEDSDNSESDSNSDSSDNQDLSHTKNIKSLRTNTKSEESDSSGSEDSSGMNDSSSEMDQGVEDENEEGEDVAEDEFTTLKKELANIPLEDLMKIKEKLGLKVFNKIMHGDTFEDKKQKVFKRENKNRPMEISSKRRVPILRQNVVRKEKVRRDPRFDDLSGEYQDKHFMKNYAFLGDIKSKEKLLVENKMKKTTNEEKKKELSKLLERMTQQEQAEQQKRKRMELEEQWKMKEKQLVREGKTPYFLKKAEKKKLVLADKFQELQKSGKVDQYLRKKLKKQAQKERKKIPERHQRFT